MKLINMFLDSNGKISASKIKACSPEIAKEIYALTPNIDPSAGLVERLYWIKHSLSDYPKKCLTCGSPVKSFYSFSHGYKADYCCTLCARRSPIATQKKHQTIKKRYGVDSIWQVDEISNKRQQTCLTKYGQTSPMHIARQAFLEQTNCLHVSAVPGILEKRLQTIKEREIKKLSEQHPMLQIDSATYENSDSLVKFTCLRCGTISSSKPDKIACPICNKQTICSSLENILAEKLANKLPGIEIIVNKKHPTLNIFPDIFIPSKNLVIELDGNYWHAEGRGGDKLKSYKRKKLLSEAGINSLFFFEDEVLKKTDIVLSMILSKLGVFENVIRASKCEIKQISKNQADLFLEENHLGGTVRSSLQLGAFYNDELVGVATFGRPRFNKNAKNELLRLCFKKNTKIHGGATKLINYAKQLLSDSILSYSDNRYSDGKVYQAMGFEKISVNSPSYFYMSKNDYLTRMSRVKFQKHKLIAAGGDPSLTEWENAQLMGLDRIYDCGTTTWLLK